MPSKSYRWDKKKHRCGVIENTPLTVPRRIAKLLVRVFIQTNIILEKNRVDKDIKQTNISVAYSFGQMTSRRKKYEIQLLITPTDPFFFFNLALH